MQPTVDIIRSVIWPVTAVIALLLLRKPLESLLPRFKSGEVLGARLEFNAEPDRGSANPTLTNSSLAFAPDPSPGAAASLPEGDVQDAKRATEALREGYNYATRHLGVATEIVAENPNMATMLAVRFVHGELVVAATRAAARGDLALSLTVGTTENLADRLKQLTPLTDYALDQIKQAASISRKLIEGSASIDALSANVLLIFMVRSIAALRAFELLDDTLRDLI